MKGGSIHCKKNKGPVASSVTLHGAEMASCTLMAASVLSSETFNHLIALRAITECDISIYHPEDKGMEKLPQVLIGGAEA